MRSRSTTAEARSRPLALDSATRGGENPAFPAPHADPAVHPSMTSRRLLALLAAALLVASPLQGAQSAPVNPTLADGIRQVDEGDLAAAVITLDGVTRRLAETKGSEADLAQAHLYLGIAQLGLEQTERAKTSMRAAFRADPALRLDPRRFSPRVIQTFAEANPEAASKSAAAPPAPAPAPTPAPRASGKGGSGKLLILGGLAAAGGGVALASGGSSATPTATPVSKAPQLVLAQSSQIPAPANGVVNFQFWNFTIPGPGIVTYTANWTSPTSEFRLYIAGTPCSDANPFATTTVSARPATITWSAGAAGTYCVGIVYQKGEAAESYSIQVIHTPQ
jgi:hypothetical protein